MTVGEAVPNVAGEAMISLPLRTDVPDADPLSDEIAIDFPSIGVCLERMQAAFFGAPVEACMSARVVLSPREAFRGTVVPLDLPFREVCPACGGRGERWSDPCDRCRGTGGAVVAHRVQLGVPAGVRDGAIFRLSVAPEAGSSTTIEVRIAVL